MNTIAASVEGRRERGREEREQSKDTSKREAETEDRGVWDVRD